MATSSLNGAVCSPNSGASAASGAVLQTAAGMYEQLKGEWNRKSPNLSKCGEELGRLKVGVAVGASRGLDRAEVLSAGAAAVPTGSSRVSNMVKDSEQPVCGLGDVRGAWN